MEPLRPLRFLNIDDLIILKSLSENKISLSMIAANLCLTQPAISQRLRKMESAFNRQIVEKAGRSLKLTAFGQEQAEKATRALSALIDFS